MAQGAARNTEANREWLRECSAVQDTKIVNDDVMLFTYDPAGRPESGVPSDVYFEMAEAPF